MAEAGIGTGEIAARGGDVVRRHRLSTRIWHWTNALTLVVMLMSGLMIFNAHPRLYWGQYGANYDPSWLQIGATKEGTGYLRIGELTIGTTGFLGARQVDGRLQKVAFPGWATIPSTYDLALSRRWHLTFAWVLALGLAGLRGDQPRERPSVARPSADVARNSPRARLGRHPQARAARLPEGRGGPALQRAAEVRLPRRPLPAPAADGPDRAHHVPRDGCDLAVAPRPLRRAADGALDPFHRRLADRPLRDRAPR